MLSWVRLGFWVYVSLKRFCGVVVLVVGGGEVMGAKFRQLLLGAFTTSLKTKSVINLAFFGF